MNKPTGAGKTGPLRRSPAGAVDPEVLLRHGGRITALEQQKDPQRRSLFVDGEFALGLDLETVVRCGFKVGQLVDGPALLRAHQLDMQKRAWDGALTLLAASPRTAKELGRRLARTYSPEVAEQVLARLAAGGWLDDREYAASYIRSHRDHGSRRLLADLVRKGVERQVAAQVVQEALGEVDPAEHAREAAATRLSRMGEIDRETAQRRLLSYLARRGFGLEAIQKALAPLLQDLPRAATRQVKSNGRRREQPYTGDSGGSSLKRNSSLQRRKPFRAHDEEEQET